MWLKLTNEQIEEAPRELHDAAIEAGESFERSDTIREGVVTFTSDGQNYIKAGVRDPRNLCRKYEPKLPELKEWLKRFGDDAVVAEIAVDNVNEIGYN